MLTEEVAGRAADMASTPSARHHHHHHIAFPDSDPDVDSDHRHDFDEEEDANIANSNARNDNSTTLLEPDILNYRTIHGRTYHAESGTARYWASNDERQNKSMDIVRLLTLGREQASGPCRCCLDTLQQTLHAHELDNSDFADRFPSTEVTGTDISPIQPNWVPPNLQFEIEDCTQPWTFEPESMDYVHMRYLYGSISDWTALFQEAYNVCRPGGWVESCEASPRMESDDSTVLESSAMAQWGPLFINGARQMGSTFAVVDDGLQVHGMEKAGFGELRVTERRIPIGGWPKEHKLREIGRYVQIALEQDMEGYMQYMAGLLGWSDDKVTVFCAKLRNEIRSGQHHAWYRLRIVCGRRPVGSGEPDRGGEGGGEGTEEGAGE